MYPKTFAAFGDDGEGGRTAIEAAIAPQYPGDDGDTPIRLAPDALDELLARLMPPAKAHSLKAVAMRAILLVYHAGGFPAETLATLAERFHVSKAGLYKMNSRLYGAGFNVAPRDQRMRQNMCDARLRRLKKQKSPAPLGTGDNAISKPSTVSTLMAEVNADGAKGGAQ